MHRNTSVLSKNKLERIIRRGLKTMSNISIKDFHVGKPAWSIEHKGNTEEIIEQSVINVGRKYVTVSRMGMERKYSELSGGRTYITDGYNSRLFPTEQSANEFIQKKDLVLRLKEKTDRISSFGEEYTLDELQKVYEILDGKNLKADTLINYSVAVLAEVAESAKQEDAPIYKGDKEVDQWVRLSDVENAINKYLHKNF